MWTQRPCRGRGWGVWSETPQARPCPWVACLPCEAIRHPRARVRPPAPPSRVRAVFLCQRNLSGVGCLSSLWSVFF